MEIRYKLYPYPVLAYYSDDYKDGSFEATIDLRKDGYNIRIDFMASLTNEGLKRLIQTGQARYAYDCTTAITVPFSERYSLTWILLSNSSCILPSIRCTARGVSIA